MENRERVFSIPFGGPIQDCPFTPPCLSNGVPVQDFCSRIHPLRYWQIENRAPVVHSFRWSSSRQSSFHSFLPIKCWTFNYIFVSNYAQLFLLSSVVTLKDANRALVFGGAVQDSPSILGFFFPLYQTLDLAVSSSLNTLDFFLSPSCWISWK